MHPRSPYYTAPPDFAQLAVKYPALQKYLSGNSIDFKDPEAARAVTRAILLHDFQLNIELSPDRLCPPVPNRLNYVLWIEDIVSETRSPEDPLQPVVGIDIGTGSTAIYPLLTCRRNPGWIMYGLESDVESLTLARKNVALNGLSERILLCASDTEAPVLLQHDVFDREITFTMCNPPFYASVAEMQASKDAKKLDPVSLNTGSTSELITAGGEVSFTASQIRDSLVLGEGVRWYSTMLGKRESVKQVVDTVRRHGIGNYAVTELVQGRTRRWAVAWSLAHWRPHPRSSRCPTSLALDLGPPDPLFTVALPHASLDPARLDGILAQLSLSWQWITPVRSRMVLVTENTWSRQARRKSEHRHKLPLGRAETGPADGPARVTMRVQVTHHPDARHVELLWRYGCDPLLFESFCGKMRQLLRQPASQDMSVAQQ